MSHQIAKLLLERADTFLERTEAVKVAMALGMRIHEIEEYLDWLEAAGRSAPPADAEPLDSDGACEAE